MLHPVPESPLCTTDLSPPYVVIGNEHSLYREVLCSSVMALRPDVSVFNVPPVELDPLLHCLQPLLVICSALSDEIVTHAGAWILLHPDVEQPTIVGVHEQRRATPHLHLGELLEVIDELLPIVSASADDARF